LVSGTGITARAPRRQRELKGFVRRCGRSVEPAAFNNVSSNGCSILGAFPIGEWLVITLPSLGTVEAQVRWSIGGRSGLRFTNAI
jgi:hypothetical protein